MSYLFAAYAAAWILIFGYVVNLGSKQRKLDEEMSTLKRLIEQKK